MTARRVGEKTIFIFIIMIFFSWLAFSFLSFIHDLFVCSNDSRQLKVHEQDEAESIQMALLFFSFSKQFEWKKTIIRTTTAATAAEA